MRNPLLASVHEWWAIAKDLRKAESLSDVVGYLFAAPGWQPNGAGETTRVLQAKLAAQEI